MDKNHSANKAIILLHCPDSKGIVLSITEFIFKNEGNILDLEQHIDKPTDRFFLRVEWDLSNFSIPKKKIRDYFSTLIANRFDMVWRLHFSDERPRMALFVTKLSHCLYDILGRWKSNEWSVDIPVIVSNHECLRHVADQFNIPFFYLPMTKEDKAEKEAEQLLILEKYKVDFVVLARYMQIVSPHFINQYEDRIINIHHSFLPAFPGAKPYHSAFERGVKIIGASSHYVTSELDAGPIIEQDVTRISHKYRIQDLVLKGQDLEKLVLSRAIFTHLQHKVLVYNNKTIVFS
jgi:formyltetrahydrofolate deformylase